MKVQTQPTNNENRKRTNMKFQSVLVIVFSLMLVLASSGYAQQKAGRLLQSGLYQEEVKGDLDEAIKVYERIIINFPKNRPVVAKALVQMGRCYEKLGRTEAQKAYQRVIQEFAEQQKQVAIAKERLAGMEGDNGKSEVTVRQVWSFNEPGDEPQSDNSGAPSPDGRYLSFCNWNYGDLAIRDLITGEYRDLTDGGQDWEGRAYWAGVSVWSPDGKQIAYAWVSYPNKGKPHELRIVGLDGSEPRVLHRIENKQRAYITPRAWSQDGKFILADLPKPDGSKEIVLVSVADGSVRVLKSLERGRRPNWRMTGKSLSPDGRYVAYERPVKENNNSCDIFLLATDGSGREVPLVEHPADDYGPVWAPDGKTIVFVSGRSGSYGVWLMQVADGKPAGEPRLVKRDVGTMRPMGFTREGSLYCGLSGSSTDVYVASLDPATGKVLAPPAKAIRSFEGSNRSPAWSPDGKNLAYVSRRPSRGSSHRRRVLVIRSVETGKERELYPEVRLEEDIRWSPDGRSILCGGSLQLIDIQTGNITNLVDPTKIRNGEAKWSHDGKTVFYIRRGVGQPRRIMARDLETGKEKELWQGSVGSLGISPDGRRLAFGGENAIKVMPTTGGELRILHRQQDGEGFGCSPTWTADGRYVLFGKRKYDKPGPMELWRIPAEGGEPQKLLALDGLEEISVHPDGRRIALTGGGGTLMEVWAMENFLPESTPGE
jgi:Tol biopolymer transport system component